MNGKKILFGGSSGTAKMEYREIVDKVIEIDNNIDNYYIRDLNLWAIYRERLFDYLVRGINKKLNIIKKLKKRNYLNILKCLTLDNPFFLKDKDKEIIYLSRFDCNRCYKDNKLFNIYYDDLAIMSKNNTLILESGKHRYGGYAKRYFKYSKSTFVLEFFSILKKKNIKIKKEEEKQIELFIEGIKKYIPVDKVEKDFYYCFKKDILDNIKYQLSFSKYYKKLLKKLNAKIVIYHDASPNIVHLLAKELGIKTAQFQHGIAHKLGIVYQFGNFFFKEEGKKYMPDYLLTRGDYWEEFMNTPSKLIKIGYPFFTKKIEEYKRKMPVQKRKENIKNILFISQRPYRSEFVIHAKYLADNLNKEEYEIIFKLHPGFQDRESEYENLKSYTNIEIVDKGEIYSLISKSDMIVSCHSTAIFEALPFNKIIFILKNERSDDIIPREIGYRFTSSKQLLSLILKSKKEMQNYDYVKYFDNKWKENYKKFLKNHVKLDVDLE